MAQNGTWDTRAVYTGGPEAAYARWYREGVLGQGSRAAWVHTWVVGQPGYTPGTPPALLLDHPVLPALLLDHPVLPCPVCYPPGVPCPVCYPPGVYPAQSGHSCSCYPARVVILAPATLPEWYSRNLVYPAQSGLPATWCTLPSDVTGGPGYPAQ